MDLKGGRLSEVLLPHEGVRKRLCAWRDRAALKDFADAAAAGDDPATALPLPAEDQEETGDDEEEVGRQNRLRLMAPRQSQPAPSTGSATAAKTTSSRTSTVGGGAAKGERGGASWWGE